MSALALRISSLAFSVFISTAVVAAGPQPALREFPFVRGLFESIPTGDSLRLSDGSQLKYLDRGDRINLTTEVAFPKTPWKGRSEMRLQAGNAYLNVIVLPFEQSPSWLMHQGLVPLDPKRGVPTSLHLILRSLKKMGVTTGSLRFFTTDKIRHPETTILMGRLLKDFYKKSKKTPLTAGQFTEMYKQTSLHRLTDLVLKQTGHRIVSMGVIAQHHIDDKVLSGSAPLQTWISAGNNSWSSGKVGDGSALLSNWKPNILDKAKLEALIENLCQLHKLELEDDGVPADFSIVYALAPLN